MGELEDSVLGLLQSSEELRAVLEAQLTLPVDTTSAASRSENYNSEDIATRILAVISHQDDWRLSEEGRCVPRYVLLMSSDLALAIVLSPLFLGLLRI